MLSCSPATTFRVPRDLARTALSVLQLVLLDQVSNGKKVPPEELLTPWRQDQEASGSVVPRKAKELHI